MAESMSTLPVLPLKNTVVYPEIVNPLAVGRAKSLAAVKAAAEAGNTLIAVAQRDATLDDPQRSELHDIGTLVTVKRVERREGGAQIIVQGVNRVHLLDAAPREDHLAVRYELLPVLAVVDSDPDHARIDALIRENLNLGRRIAQ